MSGRKNIKVLNAAQIKISLASVSVIKFCYKKNSPPIETYGHNSNNGFSSCFSAIGCFYQSVSKSVWEAMKPLRF